MNKFLRWYITSTGFLTILLTVSFISIIVLEYVYPTNGEIKIAVDVIMGLSSLHGLIILALPLSNRMSKRIRNPKEK